MYTKLTDWIIAIGKKEFAKIMAGSFFYSMRFVTLIYKIHAIGTKNVAKMPVKSEVFSRKSVFSPISNFDTDKINFCSKHDLRLRKITFARIFTRKLFISKIHQSSNFLYSTVIFY